MIKFNNKRGLCGNLAAMYPQDIEVQLNFEMEKQFCVAGLDASYPFDRGDYKSRRGTCSGDNDGTMHLCPKRLQWAFDHMENPPEGQSVELTLFYKAWYSWASSIGGVPHGYAIYSPDEQGKFTRRRCTKAEYEAELQKTAEIQSEDNILFNRRNHTE